MVEVYPTEVYKDAGYHLEEKDGRLVVEYWGHVSMRCPDMVRKISEFDITAHIERAVEAVLKRKGV